MHITLRPGTRPGTRTWTGRPRRPGGTTIGILWHDIIEAALQTDSVIVSVDWDIGSPLILTAPASGRGIRPGVMRIVTPSTKCPATARAHPCHASEFVTHFLLGRVLKGLCRFKLYTRRGRCYTPVTFVTPFFLQGYLVQRCRQRFPNGHRRILCLCTMLSRRTA